MIRRPPRSTRTDTLLPYPTLFRSIRGIGAVGTGSAPHEEQPVATYVDGVYIAAPSAAATFGFNNIQRIEVLKGPPGTLFGRNATGGAIQVVTLEPPQEFGRSEERSAGNVGVSTGRSRGSAYLEHKNHRHNPHRATRYDFYQ